MLYFNRERCEERSPYILQGAFFQLNCVSAHSINQTDGFVKLGRVRKRASGKVPDQPYVRRLADLISTAFALHMHSFHIVCSVSLPPYGRTTFS